MAAHAHRANDRGRWPSRATRAWTETLAGLCGAPVLLPDHRLTPEHTWPAPLEDALAAVAQARADGARTVVLSGDSAGGTWPWSPPWS